MGNRIKGSEYLTGNKHFADKQEWRSEGNYWRLWFERNGKWKAGKTTLTAAQLDLLRKKYGRV